MISNLFIREKNEAKSSSWEIRKKQHSRYFPLSPSQRRRKETIKISSESNTLKITSAKTKSWMSQNVCKIVNTGRDYRGGKKEKMIIKFRIKGR